MRKICIPLLILLACQTVQAQDNSPLIKSLLDSIQTAYKGDSAYFFTYGISDVSKQFNLNPNRKKYKMHSVTNKQNDCNQECICNSYIAYKGPEASYLVFFTLANIDTNRITLKDNAISIQFLNGNGPSDFYISHSDTSVIAHIKVWLETTVKYCQEGISE